jgi:hypothetical protein
VAVGKAAAHLCLTLIIKELKISVVQALEGKMVLFHTKKTLI